MVRIIIISGEYRGSEYDFSKTNRAKRSQYPYVLHPGQYQDRRLQGGDEGVAAAEGVRADGVRCPVHRDGGHQQE